MADDFGLVARWKLLLTASCDSRLSRTDVASLGAVLDRVNDQGIAWPSLARISDDCRAARRTVSRSISRLVELGYLVRESGDRTTSNRYLMGRGSDELAPSGESVPRDELVPSDRGESVPTVGTNSSPGVGTNSSHKPASLNLLNEPAQLNQSTGDGFAAFWTAYPRRVSKPAAAKAWKAKKLDQYLEAILEDIERRKADAGQWTEPKFIPHPATYLNQRRWEDEWTPTRKPAGAITRDTRSEKELEDHNAAELERFGLETAA